MILSYKLRFLLSVATLAVSVAVALFGSMQLAEMTQAERIMKEKLGCDTRDVYTLRMFSYYLLMGQPEVPGSMVDAAETIKNDSSVTLAGGFAITENDEEMQAETGISLTLYTDSELLQMFGVKDETGGQAEWGETTQNVVPALVGYDLKDRYPAGTVIKYYCGEAFDVCVTGVLSEDTTWPAAIDIGGYYQGTETYLDSAFILDFNAVADTGYLLYIIDYMSNFYIKTAPDMSDDIPGMVEAVMKENGIRADDVESIYEFNRAMSVNRMEEAGENLILPLIMLAVAVILSVMIGYVSLVRSRRDYQIFVASGMLRTDIYGIVLLETVIRTVAAVIPALIYGWNSYLPYFGEDGSRLFFHAMIWIILLSVGLVAVQVAVLYVMMHKGKILEDNGGMGND